MQSVSKEKKLPESVVFFDLETTIPTKRNSKYFLLEFASKEVRPLTWDVIEEYETLISDGASHITAFSESKNKISSKMLENAPTFEQVHAKIFSALDGKVWAGHNIDSFDCVRIKEEFERHKKIAPVPLGTIDTLTFARRNFSGIAEGQSMEKLAIFFGFGDEYAKTAHRSLADVDFNIRIFQRLLEPSNMILGNIVPFKRDSSKRKLEDSTLPENKKAKTEVYLEDVNDDNYFKRKTCSKKALQAVDDLNNGLSIADIAAKMNLKESTIGNYLSTFFLNQPLCKDHPLLKAWPKLGISQDTETACEELIRMQDDMNKQRAIRDEKMKKLGIGFEGITLCRLKSAMCKAIEDLDISKEG